MACYRVTFTFYLNNNYSGGGCGCGCGGGGCGGRSSSNNSKGKAVPLQAWSGPEGSRKLRFPDFMTTAQDGGKVVSLTHRPPLPPGIAPGTHFY